MRHLTIARAALAGILAASFPFSALSAVSPVPTAGTQVLTTLQKKGSTEIDRRIQNLKGALDKLTKSTALTATDKATLTTQVNTEIASLTALKAKLAADTTVAVARADVKSIVSDYRVYVLVLPKVRMAASADRFTVVEEKLTTLQAKLQAKVTAAKTAGHDTVAMQKSLDDMTTKIAEAKTKAAGITPQLLKLQPTDYNSNHTVLMAYRTTLEAARKDLVTARDEAKSVITALGAGSAAAHATASPSATKKP